MKRYIRTLFTLLLQDLPKTKRGAMFGTLAKATVAKDSITPQETRQR